MEKAPVIKPECRFRGLDHQVRFTGVRRKKSGSRFPWTEATRLDYNRMTGILKIVGKVLKMNHLMSIVVVSFVVVVVSFVITVVPVRHFSACCCPQAVAVELKEKVKAIVNTIVSVSFFIRFSFGFFFG